MPSALRKRILVVDDDGELLKFLAPKLEQRGFEVFRASNQLQAEEEIRKGLAHFFVLDLFLTKEVDRLAETAIPALLNRIENGHPGGKKTWMVWSSASRKKRIERDYRDKHGDQIFPKQEQDIDADVELILHLFEERTPHNWEIPIYFDQGSESLELASGQILEGTELWGAIEELLRLLIDRNSQFSNLTVIPMPEQGYSSTLKLRVTPTLRGFGTPAWYVLKAGDYDAVKREFENFQRLVRTRQFTHQVNDALEPRIVRRYRLGALLYKLVRDATQLRRRYEQCSSRQEIQQLKMIVERLFEDIANAWFRNSVVETDQLQRTRAFGDQEELAREWAHYGAMVLGLSESQPHSTYSLAINFRGKPLEIRRPNPSGEFRPIGLWISPPGHGDLHTGNVLVFEGSNDPVLIDFSETAEGLPLFRDFAKFEAHLALDLVPEPPDLQAMEQFIAWQIDGSSLGLRADPTNFGEDATQGWPGGKTLEAISWVRACFCRVITRYIASEYNTPEFSRQLLVGYYLCLWREYVRAWRWMSRLSEARRLQNLLTIDRIIDQCSRPAQQKERSN